MKKFSCIVHVTFVTLSAAVFFWGLLIAGTETSFADAAAKKMAMEKASAVFNATGSYKPANADETAVVGIIRNNLKNGFEKRDIGLIQSILAPGFEYRLLSGKESAWVDTRENYLGARKDWQKSGTSVRKLSHVIQKISKNAKTNDLTVVALSSQSSKYFSPKFIESLVFENSSGKWLLKRQAQIPLHQQNQEMNSAEIFVTAKYKGDKFMAAYKKELRRVGPSAAVDNLMKGAKWDNDEDQSVIVVFKEPPATESKVQVVIEFGPYDFPLNYEFEKVDPYFVIESLAEAEDRQDEISITVRVNGQDVAKRVTSAKDNK